MMPFFFFTVFNGSIITSYVYVYRLQLMDNIYVFFCVYIIASSISIELSLISLIFLIDELNSFKATVLTNDAKSCR